MNYAVLLCNLAAFKVLKQTTMTREHVIHESPTSMREIIDGNDCERLQSGSQFVSSSHIADATYCNNREMLGLIIKTKRTKML